MECTFNLIVAVSVGTFQCTIKHPILKTTNQSTEPIEKAEFVSTKKLSRMMQ